ncbi:MAG TPA: putative Ig domain-containing protein [Steroidobacteraceae bacterium]
MKGTLVILKFSALRAPRWRVLLNTLALCGALGAHLSAAHAVTALAISGTPGASVTAGSTYSFKPTISGGTGKTVYFGITNKPSWAGFSTVTGTLTGKPTAANVGTTSAIVIQATNGTQWASTAPFAVKVVASGTTAPATKPPATSGTLTLTGTPAGSVTAGSTFTFKPTISGGNGKTVYFSITNKPSWAGFSTMTGTLTGTPTASNVGTTSGIVIQATNGSQWASTTAFAVKVVASGGSTATVTISGTPATSVTAGSKYSFQPTAKDSAGKALSYSVQHAPSWATFSIASGLLAGTPTSAQTGVYSGIVISASDGSASSALPAFAITVKSLVAATGSATLNWVDPTQNTDGSPLTNLAGVNIHYGNSPSSLTNVVQVIGAGNSSYTIANLAAGTWYFGATAYTTAGVEGMMSAVQSKTIN